MADTITPNAKLALITPTRSNWSDAANKNFEALDAIIGTYFTINQLQGTWNNSTSYAVNDTVIDSVTSTVWTALVAHVSAAVPTTFAQDRAAHSSYWATYAAPATARGTWTSSTSYKLNDFVVSSTQYAICIATHTSTTSFTNDVTSGYWSVLIDLSSVGSAVLPALTGILDANKFVITNSGGTGYSIFDKTGALNTLGATTVGTALLQAASAAAARTAIGAQVSGSYQTSSAFLTAISSLTSAANSFPYFDASNVAAMGTITAFGRSVIDDVDATAVRTTLGLGTAATVNTGTGAGNAVILDGSARLPAVDGSQLTGLVTSSWEVGDVKLRYGTTAGAGWLLMNDGTIGNAASGATYANAAYLALFVQLYGSITDTWAPVSGGRTGNATNDFNANKRLTLSKVLGRALAISGAGSGLTSRALGENLGTETITAEMPSHNHSMLRVIATTQVQEYGSGLPVDALTSASFDNGGTTGNASSGDGTENIMQPSSFLNVFIRFS